MYLLFRKPAVGRKVLWAGVIISTLIRLLLTIYVAFIINDSNDWIDLVYLTPWCRVWFLFLSFLSKL